MRVEIMLYVYVFVCGAMIVFNIVTAILFRKAERKTEKVSKNLRYEVMLQLEAAEANSAVNKKHKLYLSRKLRKVGNMIAFDKMLEAEYISHPQEIRNYLRSLDEVFISLMAYYMKRNRIEAAYFRLLRCLGECPGAWRNERRPTGTALQKHLYSRHGREAGGYGDSRAEGIRPVGAPGQGKGR